MQVFLVKAEKILQACAEDTKEKLAWGAFHNTIILSLHAFAINFNNTWIDKFCQHPDIEVYCIPHTQKLSEQHPTMAVAISAPCRDITKPPPPPSPRVFFVTNASSRVSYLQVRKLGSFALHHLTKVASAPPRLWK